MQVFFFLVFYFLISFVSSRELFLRPLKGRQKGVNSLHRDGSVHDSCYSFISSTNKTGLVALDSCASRKFLPT